MRRGLTPFNWTALAFGFAFLYVPIVLLVLYSFNNSRLVTVWGGFSTKWYVELLGDQQIVDSAWMSLRVGVVSAALATVLGSTLAALVLARFWRSSLTVVLFGNGLCAAGHAGSDQRPVAFVDFRGARNRSRLLDGSALARDPEHVLCRRRCSCAARYDRPIVRRGGDGSWRNARRNLSTYRPAVGNAGGRRRFSSGFHLARSTILVIASFTSGPGSTTLPMRIYSEVRLGVTPEINAMSTLLLGIVAIAALACLDRGRPATAWPLFAESRDL